MHLNFFLTFKIVILIIPLYSAGVDNLWFVMCVALYDHFEIEIVFNYLLFLSIFIHFLVCSYFFMFICPSSVCYSPLLELWQNISEGNLLHSPLWLSDRPIWLIYLLNMYFNMVFFIICIMKKRINTILPNNNLKKECMSNKIIIFYCLCNAAHAHKRTNDQVKTPSN